MRLVADDGSTLWLAYGMNVHPGGDADAFEAALDSTVLPLRERLGATGPFGLAVRFHADAIAHLAADTARRDAIGARLRDEALVPFTGNAFVMGAFHGGPLKDEVYRPPWSAPSRVAYTLGFAELLAAWCGDVETDLSLSTAPGSWRGWVAEPGDAERHAENLAACAAGLARLGEQTGATVRLGLEPEPRCTLETTAEARAFFRGPLARALRASPEHSGHLGVCYDVCHQAVMHEDAAVSLAALAEDGIPLVKLQASNALEVSDPADPSARAALAAFDEPTYLHQVAAPDESGVVHVADDLGAVLADPSGRWQTRRPWRVHYHVPVHRTGAGGPLGSTHADLEIALAAAVRARLTRHVEIETYTWNVLPDTERGQDLVEDLAREVAHVLGLLAREGFQPG